jgi:hypothetical protein
VIVPSSTDDAAASLIPANQEKVSVTDLGQSITEAWNAASLRPLSPVISNVSHTTISSNQDIILTPLTYRLLKSH